MAQIQQGLAAWGATGVKVFQPYGLTLLAEALAVVDNTEERRWEAELHRLEDEFLLVRSAEHHVEAETCFRQALDSV
jgi:hypothetical protein